MTPPGLPRFAIVGAVKGATTWIHNQLQHHPDIYLPGPEPHFFSQDYKLGVDHYRSLFADAPEGAVLGEKSADYLAHPDAPRRMAALLPGARLVVQLRNPVDRAYSDYRMLYRRGTVTGMPEAYLSGSGCEQPRFLRDGLYGEHLTRWLDHFGREQMLVLLFDDVKARPNATVASVCAHIGVPYHFSNEVGATPRNDGSAPFLPGGVRRVMAPLKKTVRPLRGNAVFEGVRGVFAREVRYPPLSRELRERMTDYYARDIERLEALIGRDLSHWRRAEREAA